MNGIGLPHVRVQDIQKLYPLQTVLSMSLCVDARTMKMIVSPELSLPPKVKQTARKSVNAKLILTTSQSCCQSSATPAMTSLLTADSGETNLPCNNLPSESCTTKQAEVDPEPCVNGLTPTSIPDTFPLISQPKLKETTEKITPMADRTNSETTASETVTINSNISHGKDNPVSPIKIKTEKCGAFDHITNLRNGSNYPSTDIGKITDFHENLKGDVSKSDIKVWRKATPKSASIESIVQNLNMKQNKSVDGSKLGQKRSESPSNVSDEPDAKKFKCRILSECNINVGALQTSKAKKNGLLPVKNDATTKHFSTQTTHICTCDCEKFKKELHEYVRGYMERELLLREKLRKKVDENNKLKEKCESVERNFKRWIEFAHKLQARVKKVNHQTEGMKRSFFKEKADASVQTSDDWLPNDNKPTKRQQDQPETKTQEEKKTTVPTPSPQILTNSSNNSPSTDKVVKTAPTQAPRSSKPPAATADVIDLTNEEIPTKPKNVRTAMTTSVQQAMQRILESGPSIQTPKNQLPTANVLPTYQQNTAAQNLFGRGTERLILPRRTAQQSSSIYTSDANSLKNSTDQSHLSLSNGVVHHYPQPQHHPNRAFANLPTRMSTGPSPSKQESIPKRNAPPIPSLPQVGNNALTSKSLPPGARAPGPPPQLALGIKKSDGVIVLSWNNRPPYDPNHAEVVCYELFASQHNPNISNNDWKKIGNESIAAMPLPMACTLTQFTAGCVYYFTVRGKDLLGRYGAFSKPCSTADVKD